MIGCGCTFTKQTDTYGLLYSHYNSQIVMRIIMYYNIKPKENIKYDQIIKEITVSKLYIKN